MAKKKEDYIAELKDLAPEGYNPPEDLNLDDIKLMINGLKAAEQLAQVQDELKGKTEAVEELESLNKEMSEQIERLEEGVKTGKVKAIVKGAKKKYEVAIPSARVKIDGTYQMVNADVLKKSPKLVDQIAKISGQQILKEV